MGESNQSVEEESDGSNGYVLAITQMDPLQSRVPLGKGIDRLICDLADLILSTQSIVLLTFTKPILLSLGRFAASSSTLKSVKRSQPTISVIFRSTHRQDRCISVACKLSTA
jgi:hypothetical protein